MKLGDRSDFTILSGIALMLFGIYVLIFYFEASRTLGLIFLILGAGVIVTGQRLCAIDKKKRVVG